MSRESKKIILLEDFENSKNTKTNTDSYGILLFAISSLFYGLNGFQIKYAKVAYQDEYDCFIFSFWRNIPMGIFSYYIIRQNNIEIIDLQKIQNKFWFSIRTLGQFSAFTTFIVTLHHLRLSTASVIQSMNPAVVVLLSVLILNEKFHWRYIFGIAFCFIGSLIILINDQKQVNAQQDFTGNILIGGIFSLLNIFIVGSLNVSSKVLHSENIGIENQMFYISISNSLISLIFAILFGNIQILFSGGISFMLNGLFNGVVFYGATYLAIESVKWVDLSKTTPCVYLNLMFSCMLGVLILGEPLYLTDLIGSLFILSYNFYNSLNPVK